MTKDELLRLAVEVMEGADVVDCDMRDAITAIKAALEAKDEPVKITHKHEWFRTGEMKVGQMRCISCGTWAEEEMPQRIWVGLTDDEIEQGCKESWVTEQAFQSAVWWAEAKLKEKNHG
jgi:hypothetical protein